MNPENFKSVALDTHGCACACAFNNDMRQKYLENYPYDFF